MTGTHVSELALDRLLAGELTLPAAHSLRAHAASCTVCGAALDDALATRRAVLPPLRLPRHRVMPALAALAAAVAVVVAWPREPEQEIRTKGGAIVGFFVAHGDQVRRGAPREAVMPGDRIELFTTTSEPMWFAAVSSDGSVYVEPTRVEPGRERVLKAAIELDGSLGNEVVTGVFCPERFDPRVPPPGCATDRFTLVKVPR
jgi:hypothetical protein